MGEPTIYKPSIYNGNGVYNNGAGGGGGFEPVPNNIELHLWFEKKAGAYFHMPEIDAYLYDKQINNKFTIKSYFLPKFNQTETIRAILFEPSVSYRGSIELSLRNATNYGRFEITCEKIGNGTGYYDHPNKTVNIYTSDVNYYNDRLIPFEIKENSFSFDNIEYGFDSIGQSSNERVKILAGWRLQENNFGNGSYFYPVELYDENGSLFDILIPALKKDTGDKGVYSFRLGQFFFDYINTSKDNIELGPLYPQF